MYHRCTYRHLLGRVIPINRAHRQKSTAYSYYCTWYPYRSINQNFPRIVNQHYYEYIGNDSAEAGS